MRAARFTCRKLLRQMVVLARDLAAPTAGNRRLARIAMIAMTNKSSRSVKARGEVFVRFIPAWTAVVGNRCARCLSPSRALRRNQRAAYPSPRDAGIPRVLAGLGVRGRRHRPARPHRCPAMRDFEATVEY